MRIFILLISISFLFTPLVSAKEKGNIQIYCQPKVKVYVNKQFKSKTNEKQKGILLNNLSYKRYVIKLSKDEIDEYITIALNDTLIEYYSVKFTRPEDSNKIDTNPIKPLPGLVKWDNLEVFPEMIYEESPKYPNDLKARGVTGRVWVKVFIDKNGNVIDSEIGKSSGNELLDKAALDVAPQNKFKPAIQKGKPVAVWTYYKVEFK